MEALMRKRFKADAAYSERFALALDLHFSESTKLLCQAHIKRNSRTKLLKHFSKDDYDELQKALNYLCKPSFSNKTTGIDDISNEQLYEKALEMYNTAAELSSEPEKVKKYLKS
jgi:hypothetical protein